jgi:exopolysaccharide production protein ExoY
MDINSNYQNGVLSYDRINQKITDGSGATPKLHRTTPLGGGAKRAFDVLVAVAALCIAAPLMIATSVAIKVLDGGPIFFVQRRIGFAGRSFPCLKFRTMEVNAEEKLKQYLLAHDGAAAEWNISRKLKRDPRITFIGNALRRTSIDELPQLFNVLLGHMSMVGPRPVVAEEIQYYGNDAQTYFSARPGLTGAWQISGRSDVSYPERVQLDCGYCNQWSFAKDISIVMKTVPILLMRRGSY